MVPLGKMAYDNTVWGIMRTRSAFVELRICDGGRNTCGGRDGERDEEGREGSVQILAFSPFIDRANGEKPPIFQFPLGLEHQKRYRCREREGPFQKRRFCKNKERSFVLSNFILRNIYYFKTIITKLRNGAMTAVSTNYGNFVHVNWKFFH